MTTALKIIQRAFSKIGVLAAETPLTSAELDDGLEELNDIISEWTATGILTGISPTYDADTDLQEDRTVRSALINELAPRLCAEYGVQISQAMAQSAFRSFNAMVASNWNLDPEYPDTLPTGSGNCSEWFDDIFFDQNSKDNF